MRTSQNTAETINTIGIDVGKNTFHLVGLDKRGAIVLQHKVTRHQLGRRLSNISRCLIGMETCSGTHFIARQLAALGHDVRLIPAQYVKPFLKGHKNDYRDARTVSSRICFRAWISSPGWCGPRSTPASVSGQARRQNRAPARSQCRCRIRTHSLV
jgi:transposase